LNAVVNWLAFRRCFNRLDVHGATIVRSSSMGAADVNVLSGTNQTVFNGGGATDCVMFYAQPAVNDISLKPLMPCNLFSGWLQSLAEHRTTGISGELSRFFDC
jgi:hypothetical protein